MLYLVVESPQTTTNRGFVTIFRLNPLTQIRINTPIKLIVDYFTRVYILDITNLLAGGKHHEPY